MRSLELVAASFDELSPATAPDNSFTTLLATTVDPATEARYAVLQINSRADAAGKEGDAAAADGGFASLEVHRFAARAGQQASPAQAIEKTAD